MRWAAPVLRARLMGPALVVVVYLILRAVFGVMAEHGGLLTPSGSVSLGFALLGLSVLALRVVILFVLLPVVTYRVLARR